MRMVLAHTASVLLLSGLTWVAVSGQDCDPVFNENCGQEPPCDPVFGDCPVDGTDQVGAFLVLIFSVIIVMSAGPV